MTTMRSMIAPRVSGHFNSLVWLARKCRCLLYLHKAPTNSEVVTRLKQGDFLFVDTARCETAGSLSICDKGNPRRWTHVTSVRRIDKGHRTSTRGWIRDQYVQWVRCEEPWSDALNAGLTPLPHHGVLRKLKRASSFAMPTGSR